MFLGVVLAFFISILYIYSVMVALVYSIRVWPKVSGMAWFSMQLELMKDGGNSMYYHNQQVKNCPWMMVKPAKISWLEHLSNVFLTYPRHLTSWNIHNIAARLELFGLWLIKDPSIFFCSLFILTFSVLTAFTTINSGYSVIAKIFGLKKSIFFRIS